MDNLAAERILELATKPPEPIRETVEEFNKRLDLEIKIENKLIAEFIQKLKDLPTWSSRDNIFTINQANINDLIEEYEDSRK